MLKFRTRPDLRPRGRRDAGSRRTASSWYAAAVGCAAACALMAGCSSGGGGAASSSDGKGASGSSAASNGSGTGSAASSSQPLAAIKLASTQAQSASSMAGNIAVQVGGANPSSLTGTMQIRLKPSLLLSENMNVKNGGQTTAVQEVLSDSAIYVQAPGLNVQPGKPWVEIPFTQLSGGLAAGFGQLIQDAESANPLTQAQALTSSKNAREVGTQVINGISTTHYEGTITPAQATAALPAGLRAVGNGGVQGLITWNVWLDAQHNLRQLTETETVQGSPVNVTADVTAINPPATATLPPAGQVAILPASPASPAS